MAQSKEARSDRKRIKQQSHPLLFTPVRASQIFSHLYDWRGTSRPRHFYIPEMSMSRPDHAGLRADKLNSTKFLSHINISLPLLDWFNSIPETDLYPPLWISLLPLIFYTCFLFAFPTTAVRDSVFCWGALTFRHCQKIRIIGIRRDLSYHSGCFRLATISSGFSAVFREGSFLDAECKHEAEEAS